MQLPGRGVVLGVPAVSEAEHCDAHIAQTFLGQAPARQAQPQRHREGSHHEPVKALQSHQNSVPGRGTTAATAAFSDT